MPEILILAIETSGRCGSVGLALGGRVLATRRLGEERKYTAELLPVIRELLAEHGRSVGDVGVFAYSCGPGSFTGLRVAATVGRMLQSTVGCEVVAAATLEVVARNALSHPDSPSRIAVLLDAKRDQVYAAVYERAGGDELREVVAGGLFTPAEFLAGVAPLFWIVGKGIGPHAAVCEASGGVVLAESYWPPAVEQVLAIGERMAGAGRVCRPEEIVPLYLRPPACEEVYEQKRAEARRRRGE